MQKSKHWVKTRRTSLDAERSGILADNKGPPLTLDGLNVGEISASMKPFMPLSQRTARKVITGPANQSTGRSIIEKWIIQCPASTLN